ncbi:CsbD family protein [Ferrovibrio sp.]|uniref:CsbD family protein n=1 Tax=Ferrovibrio sp. TaxID=1917215 RepID=UPI00345CBB5E|nr:CsbD family protein [Ferrovibrio sp.]
MTNTTARVEAKIAGILPSWDRVAGNWKQFSGKAKERWGKLTDDDLTVIDGRREQLVGKLQERYGIMKDEAEREISAWMEAADKLDKANEASNKAAASRRQPH